MRKRTMMTIWLVVLLLVGGALLGACGGETPTSAPATAVPTAVEAPATPAPTDEAPAATTAPTQAPAEPTEASPEPTEAPPEPTETPVVEEAPAIDAAALLQARCVDCHSLSRITEARYTQEQWQAVVTRMIQRGAVLNAEEEAALVAYLAETYMP